MDGDIRTPAEGGSPGSQGFDGRNWQPATTPEEYVRNCRDGLEEYSDRRMAKLLGVPRIELYRMKMMAAIPEDLFEQLLAAGVDSTKAFAQIGVALRRGEPEKLAGVELCPHCGSVVRLRWYVGRKAGRVIAAWFKEKFGGET